MTGASGAGLSSDWAAQHARAIIPLSLLQYQDTAMAQTDRDPLIIAGVEYQSRLLVGTGKYKDLDETRHAVEASGAEIITVAIRRTNIGQRKDEPNLLDVLPPNRYTYLPNTAGCYNADDAIRTCRLARELLDGHDLVKLEVQGDEKPLFPDIVQTLAAAEVLIKDGFKGMVYTNDDPIVAKRFEAMGCVAVMPLAAPIGSGLGVRNPYNILTIVENAEVPILVDAGVGTASDAAVAMELGCDGVLMNTAIAGAKQPVLMASAMKKAIEAGREAFLAGRIPRKRFASASSPIDGTFFLIAALGAKPHKHNNDALRFSLTTSMNEPVHRRIRSYVRREGRMTKAQQSALARLWPRYVVEPDTTRDHDALFGRGAPRVLEIGFGMGDSLAAMAAAPPERDYLGIEVHRPGVGSLLARLDERGTHNVRFICGDAVDVLQNHLADAALDTVQLFFPDPWPKKRHHKRRIVQLAFVELLRRKLKPGGIFHAATDWEDYAEHVLTVMASAPGFSNTAATGRYTARPDA